MTNVFQNYSTTGCKGEVNPAELKPLCKLAHDMLMMICSSQTVRLVSHCFTTRTSRTGRGLVYTPQVPLIICSSQTVRVVNQYFMTRTSRGLVYTPQGPAMICSSQTVRLVSHCFTTCTSPMSRTGRGLLYI